MNERGFNEVIGLIGYAIEVAGVVVILAGLLGAGYRYGRRWQRDVHEDESYQEFRRDLGRSLIIGLEFLVVGDIVRTVVVSNSLTDIAGLGLLVLIRTVLVFTIHLEVDGRWPWQTPAAEGSRNISGRADRLVRRTSSGRGQVFTSYKFARRGVRRRCNLCALRVVYLLICQSAVPTAGPLRIERTIA